MGTQDGLISYEGKDKDGAPVKVTYLRSQLSSQSDFVKNEIDPAFSNDNYVLLFVLHVSWDGGAKVTDEGMHKLPLGNGSAQRVVVKYPRRVAMRLGTRGNSTSAPTIGSRNLSTAGAVQAYNKGRVF